MNEYLSVIAMLVGIGIAIFQLVYIVSVLRKAIRRRRNGSHVEPT